MARIYFFIALACLSCRAAVLDAPLTSVADTCLIEVAPDNNMGGELYFNAGSNMHANRNRGLIRFDLSAIPQGSVITSATCTVVVVGVPTDAPNASIFDLHRILQPWGEGTELATQGSGRGSPAATNECTWNDRFAFANAPWSASGGQADVDFVAASSAEKFISDQTSYPFRFGTLAQDVQLWLDHPETNFGWILMTRDESQISTARRFGSREDAANAPTLDVSFIPATHIDAPQISSNQMTFSFVAFSQQAYAVEYSETISTNWITLTNIAPVTAKTNIVVSDALATGPRYYRLSAK